MHTTLTAPSKSPSLAPVLPYPVGITNLGAVLLFCMTMKNLRPLVASLLLVAAQPSMAQGPTYRAGEVLVMLRPGADPHVLIDELRMMNGQPTGAALKRTVSAPWRTYLLRFDEARIAQPDMLRAVRSHKDVQLAQNNHLVQQRVAPNDTQYGNQWHHDNIDSEAAWNISTGGVTATGDTIVVCIIENADLPHPDLIGNAWFNRGEIPNNGVDDDGNGYVDDHRGWNPGSNNDNVYGGGHGTQVAGMIGARGNNSLGVSGANWNVKMMVVDYSSADEADVVESYTYPWVMRRDYNETGGGKGAFVVSTNASWGIDNGQPEDSPLWCAVYDSLGAEGILNCGATSNSNVNVDAVGDLPTACASEFMISVTATNDQDNRTFSAYGATTIDVGAPGASVFTTNLGGGYGSTSGTSFASPLTAGVIGLLYSAPCASLMALVNADPAEGARYVRDKLFEGVEQVGNLAGQTVTGGRISAGNSMELIMNACGTCPGAFGLAASSPAIGASTLSWNAPTTGAFDVRFRAVGTDTWTSLNGLSGPTVEVTGLSACTPYEFQVRPLCDGEESDFGASFVWTSEGCCNAPLTLEPEAVADDAIDLSWTGVLAAQQYTVRYRVQGTTAWTLANPTNEAFGSVTGLVPCTTYEFQVAGSCAGVEETWSASIPVATTGCGACVDNTYCDAAADDGSDEWIANVSIGGLQNASGSNDGYGDFTGTAVQMELGQSYPVSLSPGFSFFQYNERWAVFLDADQDAEFSPQEQLFTAGPSNTTVTGTLTVPASALAGVTRLRVMMKYNTAIASGCENADFGETEDYCVELLTPLSVDAPAASPVRVFPSPADRVLFIDLDGEVDARSIVRVMDESGRLVLEHAVGSGRTAVPVAGLSAGIYLFRIGNGKAEIGRGRFVVAHLR